MPAVQLEMPVVSTRPLSGCPLSGVVSTVLERGVAGLLLLLLSPLLLLLGLATLALSGRAPLIAHRRVGQYGRELWVWKFRTMWGDGAQGEGWLREYIADEHGPDLKGPSDARVTSAFAAFCRRHSLDELPQLVSVARGEMSLVGPRPVTEREMKTIFGRAEAEIVQAKPGLTGLWQVSGRNRLSAAERRNLDLELARNRSIGLCIWILLRTVPELLSGKNTW